MALATYRTTDSTGQQESRVRSSDRHRRWVMLLVSAGLCLLPCSALAAGGEGDGHTLIASMGISILAATLLAFVSHAARQPALDADRGQAAGQPVPWRASPGCPLPYQVRDKLRANDARRQELAM
jgi:hypothetical protein